RYRWTLVYASPVLWVERFFSPQFRQPQDSPVNMDRCGWFLIQGRTRSYRASVALTSPSLYRWIFRCALSSPPHADHATSAEYLSVLAFTPSRLHKESSVLLSKANSARATFNVSTVFHGFGDGHPRNAQPALRCLL